MCICSHMCVRARCYARTNMYRQAYANEYTNIFILEFFHWYRFLSARIAIVCLCIRPCISYVCMCMCTCIYAFTWMLCTRMCACTYMRAANTIFLHLYMIRLSACTYVYTYIYIHTNICVHMSACLYVHSLLAVNNANVCIYAHAPIDTFTYRACVDACINRLWYHNMYTWMYAYAYAYSSHTERVCTLCANVIVIMRTTIAQT